MAESSDPGRAAMRCCTPPDQTSRFRVPLRSKTDGGELIGWLLVGPRPDGSLLSKDEQRALIDVADPMTRAIRIVARREQREHALGRRIEALEARLRPERPKVCSETDQPLVLN